METEKFYKAIREYMADSSNSKDRCLGFFDGYIAASGIDLMKSFKEKRDARWGLPILIEMVDVGNFLIGKFPVTQDQWVSVMGQNPSYFKGGRLPVESVSFFDCLTFIQKLNNLTGKKYRLPTEKEWEFAAMGGFRSNGFIFSGSNNLDDVGWYIENSDKSTHPVGLKLPNELGLFDMSGNVYEWCDDLVRTRRVQRGGSWLNYAESCRATYRNYDTPENRNNYVGFRLVLSK